MSRTLLMGHLGRLRRHGMWMALAVGGQWLCRSALPRSALEGATDLAGNFLQTFGGMYGVIVAFVIYVVWQQHIETQVTIEREAVSLCELYRLLSFFRSWPACASARAQLEEYARIVPLANERTAHAGVTDERKLLEQSFGAFLKHKPTDPQEQRLYSSALDLFRQLVEVREHRTTIAALRLPDALRWFVFLGGAACVCTLWLAWIESSVLQSLFTAGMTWVVVAASSIVVDLDDPYTGDFIVNWHRFHVVEERMLALRENLPDAGPKE